MIDIDIVLLILKIAVLLLLYLFLWYVVRRVVANARVGAGSAAEPMLAAPAALPRYAAPARQSARRSRLLVESSRVVAPGTAFQLEGEAIIGRAASSDIVIDEGTVSSEHAVVVPTVDGCRVEDLGSTNGTFVDGRRVTNVELSRGQRLKVGDTVFVYEERE